ncbi:MAG: glycosyltransferase family 39 protein [Chloracidobacterium sp.]|uniref:Glycosyltransferase family 39 protein n=1 Tax=Chloracidobacterium validum TaxID=2821543 RepID=A0ABX8BF56_9BACT|nr:glycosyltransferase family 39 protein [Chloracidobacterium validum]QUW04304.1 glycosyltransferase family 39 protein [Chloracidobacterium validum]
MECHRTYQAKPRLELAVLGLFTVLYGLRVTYEAAVTPIWLDEWYTICVATMPTFREMIGMIWDGPDTQPPLFYLITRGIIDILGESNLTLRLPSTVGFWVFCISLYLFVRVSKGSIIAASVALVFPCVIHSSYYAREARPYALVLGCLGIALVCWQLREQKLYSIYCKVGLAISLSLAVSLHYFAIFSVFAFFATDFISAQNEFYKSRDVYCIIKDFSRKSLIYLCPLIFLLLHLPLLQHKSKMPFWKTGISIEELLLTYSEPFVHVRFLLLLVFILSIRLLHKEKPIEFFGDSRISTISVLFILLPLVFFSFTVFLNKTFFLSRYVLAYVIGCAIILASLIWRLDIVNRFAFGTLMLSFIVLINPRISFFSRRASEIGIDRDIRESKILSEVKSNEMVFMTDQSYLPMYYYDSNLQVKYLYLLSAYTHSFPDQRLEALKKIIPVVQRNPRCPRFFYVEDLLKLDTPHYVLLTKWALKTSKAEFPSLNLDYIPIRSSEKFVLYKKKV